MQNSPVVIHLSVGVKCFTTHFICWSYFWSMLFVYKIWHSCISTKGQFTHKTVETLTLFLHIVQFFFFCPHHSLLSSSPFGRWFFVIFILPLILAKPLSCAENCSLKSSDLLYYSCKFSSKKSSSSEDREKFSSCLKTMVADSKR